RLEVYREHEGFAAFEKVVKSMEPQQVVDEVKRFFRGKVYRSIITRNVRLSEAPSHGKPISLYDPKSKGAELYRELAREVAESDEERAG
ncbi:MAG: hypothetical protein M1602_02050, partial [Firmicutes bacterium]|nr:hypothetical protein [Bacillota bacterium]